MNNNVKNININDFILNFFNYIKSGPIVTILIFILMSFGFSYISGYYSYFNVDISFYDYNLFKDFFSLIISTMLLVIPFLSVILISILVFYLIVNFKNIKTPKIKILLQFLGLILFLILLFLIWSYNINKFYNIDFIITLKSFGIMGIIGCTISSVIGVFKVFLKDTLKGDFIDLIFIIIILLTIFLILVPQFSSLGYNVARDKNNFIIIDNKYVVLYNTSDYAIVAKYETDNGTNKIKIMANQVMKIDLDGRMISYKNFEYRPEIIK